MLAESFFTLQIGIRIGLYCGSVLVLTVSPLKASADSWCTDVSYSAALSAGMNRNLGTNANAGGQGQQCFTTHDACESARLLATTGVSSTPCKSQGGSPMPGLYNSATSPRSSMSSNSYRPNYSNEPDGGAASEVKLVNAKSIALERPWEPPPTCVLKFPIFSDEYGELLKRYQTVQTRVDADAVRCSGGDAGANVEAAGIKPRQGMQAEINDYSKAAEELNDSDRTRCNHYVESVQPSPNALVAWKNGLSCVVSDIAARAAALGPAGRSFGDQLVRDAASAKYTPVQAQGNDDVAVVALSVSNLLSLKGKSGNGGAISNELQLIADIQVFGHGSDGSVVISASSALEDASRHRSDERNTTLVFDRAGHMVGGEYTPAVRACLR